MTPLVSPQIDMYDLIAAFQQTIGTLSHTCVYAQECMLIVPENPRTDKKK